MNARLAALLALPAALVALAAQEERLEPRFLSKRAVELPLETALASAADAPSLAPALDAGAKVAPGLDAGAKVAPGRVRWHPDFARASAAAREIGKPVLHFQLLGPHDDELC
jgi:hypothetical protein